MRLTRIKLAGFKSFVDPTTIMLPSNLVGIVGPNGCGKSNAIDAVRWVMGEGSARNLRGESMADVIFTGSSTRKPVGQASVELVFDNTEGRLSGLWSSFSEVAVRRLVTRDGHSTYFLNGTRCRRRDVTALFMGTGLGPRSYAIIEQGMISRVIESKPEELRVFLEEAAGISKYKARRRETEIRIAHTRENLERLNDLREELSRQLQHLERQAKAAERFREYRAEERRLKAAILARRWQSLDQDIRDRETDIRDRELALAAGLAELDDVDTQLTAARQRQRSLAADLDLAQESNLELGAEVARLEQRLDHYQDMRRRQETELCSTEHELQELLDLIALDQTRVEELDASLSDGTPDLQAAVATEQQLIAALAAAQHALKACDEEWDAFAGRAGEPQRLAEVERTHIEHMERQLAEQKRRRERLQVERGALADSDYHDELATLQEAERDARDELASHQVQLAKIDAEVVALRESHRDCSSELDAVRERLQTAGGRLVSLETLQDNALGRGQAGAEEWLRDRQLDGAPRLIEAVDVESGWERAVETVLGAQLEAVCVPDLEQLGAGLDPAHVGVLTFFEPQSGANRVQSEAATGLAAKVHAPWPLEDLLQGVGIAADVGEALVMRRGLGANESLVTPNGTWLGRCWLKFIGGNEDAVGTVAREREIRDLRVAIARDSGAATRLTASLEQCRVDLGERETDRARLQDEVQRRYRDHTQLDAQVGALRARLEQASAREDTVRQELEELSGKMQHGLAEAQAARVRLEEALSAMEQLAQERDDLTSRRDRMQRDLTALRERADVARTAAQEQALSMEVQRASAASARQALERSRGRLAVVKSRIQKLTEALSSEDTPLEAMQVQLEELTAQRSDAEQAVNQVRTRIREQESTVRRLENARAEHERLAQSRREALEARRLGCGESKVHRRNVLEQIRELGTEPQAALTDLSEEMPPETWEAQLEQVQRRIQRLGPINLAAIDEFAERAERKQYLDVQNDDLVESLAALEGAIRKIDAETRARFRDTFDRVEGYLQDMFPRLFGGGHVHLELTGDDVLEAGVAIMASPPGKRIGNIHLLSGGEKALTAVALVFAIFQLNPAPFCMLDEVDAPLDEANVGRFGDLVREMSEQVQFIVITHNKATMEVARQLIGVTMHEPGVSRLVAVDVDEAVRLAVV